MIETVYPVVLTVVPYKGHGHKGGYCIKHNQEIGWIGTTKQTYGWFRRKEDAVWSKNLSQKHYNDEQRKLEANQLVGSS